MSTAAVGVRIQIENLLFATDFSASSDAVLPYVLCLARRYRATVHVVQLASPGAQETVAAACEQLRKLADSARLSAAAPETMAEEGEWSSFILPEFVRKHHIDLIAMGTHGDKFPGQTLDPLVEETLLRAECALLTTAGSTAFRADGELHHILLPVDFRPRSLAALPYATALAKEFQAPLTLLHVAPQWGVPIDEPCIGGLLETEPAPVPDPRVVTASLNAQLRSLIHGSELPRVTYAVEFGDPSQTILDFARKRDIGLVVMGVQRPRAWSPYVKFSTAYRVVASAPCPVLTIPVLA